VFAQNQIPISKNDGSFWIRQARCELDTRNSRLMLRYTFYLLIHITVKSSKKTPTEKVHHTYFDRRNV